MRIIQPMLPSILLLCIVLLAVSCPNEGDPVNVLPDEEVSTAMEFTASMKIGWTLGNSLDAHNDLSPGETAWGNPPITQALLDAVAAKGFGAVRIPVTWGSMIGPAPNYAINASWLRRVAEVVEYAGNAGMKSIINIHHDGADSHYWLSVKTADLSGPVKTEMDAKFIAVWKQIAQYFQESGNYLIFEAFNELHDGSWGNGNAAQHARVNELNQIFVNTVRAAGGKNSDRFLVIPGWVTRPSVTVQSLVLPKDTAKDRLIVTFHYYDPYDFAGSAKWETWGSKSLTGSNGWANENYLRNTFNSVKNKFIDSNIPVIIGEYGAVRQSSATGKAHRKYYMEYVTKYAADCGFVPFYWDNGALRAGSEGFGLFNRISPSSPVTDAEEIIGVMMKAVNEDYSLADITPP